MDTHSMVCLCGVQNLSLSHSITSVLELYSSQLYLQCELNDLYYLYSSSTDDLGPVLCPNTSRMISNRHRIQTPVNPTTIFGRFNFAWPEEWPSIWARIQVFPCLALHQKWSYICVQSNMVCKWCLCQLNIVVITLKGYKMSIISFPRPKIKN